MKKLLRKIKWKILYGSYPSKNLLRFGLKFVKCASLGDNVRVGGKVQLCNAQNLYIGDNVLLGNDSYIDAMSEIRIGNGCMLAPKIFMVAGTHNYAGSDLKAVPYDNRLIDSPIVIEDNVWIGGNVSIAPGAHIGKGSVIGLGCVIAGDVPPYSVVIGEKGRVIKRRSVKVYEHLVDLGLVYGKAFAGKDFEMVQKDDLDLLYEN